MNFVMPAAVAALLLAAPALAQAPPPVVAVPSTVVPVVATPMPTAESTGSALPANTELWLSANAEVNSKRIKQGEKFDMSVTRDVMLGNYVVIPRGTRGIGQISYRTGKGAFGKSAKMEFQIVEIDLGGRQFPLRGSYRIEGAGNTGATVATAVAVGVFSAFVTGRSAIVAPGTEYRAYTSNPIPIVLGTTSAAMAPASAGTMAAAAAIAPQVAEAALPAVTKRAAKTPSGFCLDVPAGYAGTGSAARPAVTSATPACRDVAGL